MLTAVPRPLPHDALAAIHTIPEVCAILQAWHRPDLADQIGRAHV